MRKNTLIIIKNHRLELMLYIEKKKVIKNSNFISSKQCVVYPIRLFQFDNFRTDELIIVPFSILSSDVYVISTHKICFFERYWGGKGSPFTFVGCRWNDDDDNPYIFSTCLFREFWNNTRLYSVSMGFLGKWYECTLSMNEFLKGRIYWQFNFACFIGFII